MTIVINPPDDYHTIACNIGWLFRLGLKVAATVAQTQPKCFLLLADAEFSVLKATISIGLSLPISYNSLYYLPLQSVFGESRSGRCANKDLCVQ